MRALWKDWETLDPSKVDCVHLIQHREGEWVIYLVYWVSSRSRGSNPIYEGNDDIVSRRKAYEIAERFDCPVIEPAGDAR